MAMRLAARSFSPSASDSLIKVCDVQRRRAPRTRHFCWFSGLFAWITSVARHCKLVAGLASATRISTARPANPPMTPAEASAICKSQRHLHVPAQPPRQRQGSRRLRRREGSVDQGSVDQGAAAALMWFSAHSHRLAAAFPTATSQPDGQGLSEVRGWGPCAKTIARSGPFTADRSAGSTAEMAFARWGYRPVGRGGGSAPRRSAAPASRQPCREVPTAGAR